MTAFVPPAPSSRGPLATPWCIGSAREGRTPLAAAASEGSSSGSPEPQAIATSEPELDPYDWQRVAQTKGEPSDPVPVEMDTLSNLPSDVPLEEAEVQSLRVTTQEREVLPELPFDDDL